MVIENKEISPKDTETYVSPSLSVGSSSPIRMPPKRAPTSETLAITLATIQRLITDGIAAALETQAINTNDTSRNLEPRETPVAKRGNYIEFISFNLSTSMVRKEQLISFVGESSHWQYKFPVSVEGVPTARRMEIPLPGVCTAMIKKLPVKDRWQLH
nr:hypothetical protein [Tanacetum cinerariifolium]